MGLNGIDEVVVAVEAVESLGVPGMATLTSSTLLRAGI